MGGGGAMGLRGWSSRSRLCDEEEGERWVREGEGEAEAEVEVEM